jgi:hypothetical protein
VESRINAATVIGDQGQNGDDHRTKLKSEPETLVE